ncbi:MAG TPA: gamma-glutamyltransferase family protein [Aestuariivirga sp.]|nr:gamma-glutamyltransferase family protein [Aestuariivirga sp.]
MRNFDRPGKSVAMGTNGMAATSSPLATLAAIDVLRAGGNAVDAAITASAILCLTEPHMTGIGGDCFALIGKPNGTVLGLNGSGRSSAKADADWLKASGLTEIAPHSVHTVTVPGAIDAWDRLLQQEGTMTLGEALKPAIKLAEQGVPTTPRVARDWPEAEALLAADEGGAKHYLKNGRSPREGEIMAYPALAKTLKIIARKGRAGFYEGEIAAEIVRHLAARGGLLSAADFAATEATWVKPIATRFADHDILEIPPNGQGLTVLIALNILQHFGLKRFEPESPERRHLEIEAVKLAWILRNRHIADPDFAEIPVSDLLSEETSQRLASLIDTNRATDANISLPSSDTVYLSVVDKHRLSISFINSIYYDFGSGIITPKSGITLQNRGKGFVTQAGHPNCIGPSKRPLHTLIPAMARKDGKIDMSFGVMGGDFQPMGQVNVVVNRYIYGMDPQAALDFPRLFPQGEAVLTETTVPAAVLAALAAKGHRIMPANEPLGGGQAIAIDHATGLLIGGSDHRKDGFALGY